MSFVETTTTAQPTDSESSPEKIDNLQRSTKKMKSGENRTVATAEIQDSQMDDTEHSQSYRDKLLNAFGEDNPVEDRKRRKCLKIDCTKKNAKIFQNLNHLSMDLKLLELMRNCRPRFDDAELALSPPR